MCLRVLLWLIETIGGAALRGWVERLFCRDASAGAHDATVAEATHATAQAQGDVAPDRLPRQQARILEDHGAAFGCRDRLAVGSIEARQGAQQGGLA